jgi:alpha-L-arabinofuranosidase
MLLMLKEQHVRTQCLFTLVQLGYRADAGMVRLWGTALNMRAGQERYRPTFLACSLANKVIGGNLVETVQSGANPTLDATGVYDPRQGAEAMTLPCLWTYAFADGKKRGLILLNLDAGRALPVSVVFDGTVTGSTAHAWILTADKITANNEYEAGEPQVSVKESDLPGFRSGAALTLPPYSMQVITWEVQ